MSRAAESFGAVADRAVHLPDADALVCADLHLGRAASSMVDVPLGEGRTIVDRLGSLVERFEPDQVVLAGDVLHAFGHVPREARTTLDELRSVVEEHSATLVALTGNHDTQLAALEAESPAEASVLADGTVVCHGHERPSRTGHRYVIGHDHPTIVIEGRRRPCFLYGPGAYEGADVLALPAFNQGVPGTAVNGWADGDPLSPLLADASRFQPVVWDDDTDEGLVFPPLGALRSYL